ncbi:15-hydroxyprostaglandin dehydrogenase [NAD(+)] [Anthophora quadrimaculata]
MLSRCVTSFVSNLLNKNPRSLWKIERCQFHVDSIYRKKKEDEGPRIIKPGNCAELPEPILDPACKNALVIGGSEGFGFTAADHLLCKGAHNVVMLDQDAVKGYQAAQKLCDAHGKNRLIFIHSDIRITCQFEASLRRALCKLGTIHIIFNDLDKERFPLTCAPATGKEKHLTKKTILAGLKILGKKDGGSGGIIINCASIFGFMGWPENPEPVYCKKEAAIEITKYYAVHPTGIINIIVSYDEVLMHVLFLPKELNDDEETGVRLVALCPANKQFCDIGLPVFPDKIPNQRVNSLPPCIPTEKYHIGTALSYVLAWAEHGSAWLVEPAVSAHKVPRLIYFPEKEGDKVDPKIYEAQNCTVKLEQPCASAPTTCSAKVSCVPKTPKKK